MKAKNERNIIKRLGVWAIIVACILTIPLIGQWPWTGSDFVFGVVMLFGSATIFELATKNVKNPKYRYVIGAGVFFVLATVWVILATG